MPSSEHEMSRLTPTLISWILSTSFEDSRIWTFSLSVSAGLVAFIGGLYLGRRAHRKSDTYVPPDTGLSRDVVVKRVKPP